MIRHDVALWLAWPSDCPEYVAYLEADNPLQAVLLLMEQEQLAVIAKAAVKALGLPIERWYGVRLEISGAALG